MAYVALSRDLIYDIRSKIQAMRRTEFDAIKPPEGKSIAPYQGALAYARQKLLDKHRPPGLADYDHLFTRANRLALKSYEIDVFVYEGEVPAAPPNTADAEKRPFNQGRVELQDVPVWMRYDTQGKHVDSYDRARVYLSLSEVMANAPQPELVQRWLDVYHAQIECRDRWNKVEKQLLAFLDTCKSLNEALKTLPDIERYVDQHYLDRVAEKRTAATSKRKTDEEARKAEVLAALAAVEVDVVRSSEVLARMASSSTSGPEF